MDTLVQLGQREEAVMAQPRQDPTLDDLYGDFCLGLVLRLIRPCGYDRQLIVFC